MVYLKKNVFSISIPFSNCNNFLVKERILMATQEDYLRKSNWTTARHYKTTSNDLSVFGGSMRNLVSWETDKVKCFPVHSCTYYSSILVCFTLLTSLSVLSKMSSLCLQLRWRCSVCILLVLTVSEFKTRR